MKTIEKGFEFKPCVRCLGPVYRNPQREPKTKKIKAYILQCFDCGFNVTSWQGWDDAERQWNGFKAWDVVSECCKK